MSKLNIGDLLSSLQKSQNQKAQQTPKFIESVLEGKNKKINVLSKKKQQMMKRQSNYEMTKQQMDKWVGIIKINRQKQSLNFQQKQISNLNVNFFPAQPINDFHKKIQQKLQNMNIKSQKSVLKHQQYVLQKVDPQQAKRRLIQGRKHRTAIFYQQQKRRRISKIKSKLYHKIKKRQKIRQQTKKISQMSPGQKNTYIQKLTKQRIKQRITLRHNTKNKHIKNLLRFNKNQKDTIQIQINEINNIRNKKLQKLNQQIIDQMSQQYDDQNFRQQAMKDLQKQIQAIQNQQNLQNIPNNQIDNNLKDLKFIQNAKSKRLKKQKQSAIKILNKLQKGKQIKNKDVNSDMQSENNLSQNSNQSQSSQQQQQQFVNRKIYGNKIKQDIIINNPHSYQNKKNIQSQINNYLLIGNKNNQQKNLQLIKGINLQNLQSKYQPDRIPIDLTTLIAQNRQIYQTQNNQAIIQNIKQFQQQKFAEIQHQLNKNDLFNKNKQLKGWGSWVGPGIREKRKDPKQQLQKKLKAIQQIKRKRKDNSLAHVTINETRNKNLSQYFVKDLPHNFSNPDQFDFMQSEPIGPEWNSFNQFKDNIKPKIITRAGEVITPVRLPKKIQNQSHSKKK